VEEPQGVGCPWSWGGAERGEKSTVESKTGAPTRQGELTGRRSGGWGVVPSGPWKMFYVFLKSCFVYILSFRVKVLNINGFAQPQRMRIDNTGGVMQKRNHHMVLIIPSITNKCLFLPLSLPHLPLAYVLILVA